VAGPSILLVDDSRDYCASLVRALQGSYRVTAAQSTSEALESISPPPDAILLDLRLEPESDNTAEALDLLQHFRATLPEVPVLIITAYGDIDQAVACMRLGAADFVEKGKGLGELKARLEKALAQARVATRLRQLEEELAIVEPRELVGASAAMAEVKEMIAAVARDAQVTVLLTGETGTGKELVARAIHASGSRGSRPFVPVAVTALPATTVEAELFGYEPGAFTDARQRHVGFIERAEGGVLFLDEIAELPPATQVKLLRFLEERTISRLGGREEIPVDVQVITATNADLGEAIRRGAFREDLYYRLKVCEIRLPPLRERREDLPLLVEHFLAKLGARGRGLTAVSEQAMAALDRYGWPGNVRELRNALEAALLKASLRRHRQVALEDLPAEVGAAVSEQQEATRPALKLTDRGELRPLEEVLAEAELAEVERALAATGGRKTEAWKRLGLNDRYVFTRRVRRLCGRYPRIAAKFPSVTAAFGPKRKPTT
jgi:DNA-binding NtrC family response regulator